MTALVRSELLKVRTVRSWWAYLIVIALLTGLAVASEIGPAEELERDTVDFQLTLVDSVGIAALMAIILGITIVTSEFRHGTITPALLAEPRRERVVAGKAVATKLVAIGFALLSLAVVVAVTLPWYAAVGADPQLGDGEIATRALQGVVLTVVWALLGVAGGTLLQSQVGALVGTLVWIFLGETLLVGLFNLLDVEGVEPYLPFRALDALDGTGGEQILSYWPGLAVSLGWVALLGGAGILRLRRRDIS